MVHKIVLADSLQSERESIEKFLTQKGYIVFSAKNGQEACVLTFSHNPNVIITDMDLPLMNGFEFCKTLKNNLQSKDIPVIILSSNDHMRDSFMFLGLRHFVSKPVDTEQLNALVKDRLSLTKAMHAYKTRILFHCVKPVAMSTARFLIEGVPQWESKFVVTGQQLLQIAKDFTPEVIVIDLFMNDMPVDEVVETLKAMPELANTDILTYYSPLSTAQESLAMQAKMIEVQYLKRITLEAGAKEYLGPFNPDNFMSLFKEYRKDIEE